MNQLNHLALIPDGNMRWAKAGNKSAYDGYEAGNDRILELARHARRVHGIHTQTVWCLSTENWRHRPKAELVFLVDMFMSSIDDWVADAHEDQIRLVHIGNRTRLPAKLLRRMAAAEAETAHYDRFVFNVCLDYGGHDELARALARLQADPTADPDDPEALGRYLDTAGQPHPNPDLIIRTSGEVRLSGFMSWQSAYAEFYFAEPFFPDFTPAMLDEAVAEYARRGRRFGGGH
jgi:undecaprenyl diphosphate synthase